MHSAPTSIRPAADADIPQIVDLAAAAGLSYWPPADYHAEITRPDSFVLVTETAGEFRGFIAGRFSTSTTNEGVSAAEIMNIAVARGERRGGTGRTLMNAFVSECVARGVAEIWLEVRSKNEAAISFYRSFGFVEVHRRANYYANPTDNAVLMSYYIRLNKKYSKLEGRKTFL